MGRAAYVVPQLASKQILFPFLWLIQKFPFIWCNGTIIVLVFPLVQKYLSVICFSLVKAWQETRNTRQHKTQDTKPLSFSSCLFCFVSCVSCHALFSHALSWLCNLSLCFIPRAPLSVYICLLPYILALCRVSLSYLCHVTLLPCILLFSSCLASACFSSSRLDPFLFYLVHVLQLRYRHRGETRYGNNNHLSLLRSCLVM